jgi:hypothetical protein
MAVVQSTCWVSRRDGANWAAKTTRPAAPQLGARNFEPITAPYPPDPSQLLHPSLRRPLSLRPGRKKETIKNTQIEEHTAHSSSESADLRSYNKHIPLCSAAQGSRPFPLFSARFFLGSVHILGFAGRRGEGIKPLKVRAHLELLIRSLWLLSVIELLRALL